MSKKQIIIVVIIVVVLIAGYFIYKKYFSSDNAKLDECVKNCIGAAASETPTTESDCINACKTNSK